MFKVHKCDACGSTDIHLKRLTLPKSRVWFFIECSHCGRSGLRAISVEQAVKNWNDKHYKE